MELRQLRYVVAVAEELHFGKAAQREHITPSALSQQIARLERELGVTLFERAPRRVRTTPAGHAFLLEARLSLAAAGRATSAARSAAALLSGDVCVGFTSHGPGAVLPTLLREFGATHPQVHLHLRELDFVEHFTALESHAIDVLFVRGPKGGPMGPRVVHLWQEPRLVALPADHPFAARPPGTVVEASELAVQRFFALPAAVPQWWAEHFAPWGAHPQAPTINTSAEVLSLVAAGLGVALVPASLAELHPRTDVVYRPAKVSPSAIGLAWHPAPATDAFAASVRRLADV